VQWDLVVGDVVVLKAGDAVPADCVIIKSENLQVDTLKWFANRRNVLFTL